MGFNNRRRSLIIAAAAAVGTSSLRAQSYPSRPIRLVVGFPAGGGVDAMARLIGPRLSAVLGQQIVVDNRAGAAGLLAGDAVAKAAPDGYTVLLGESGLLVAQHLQNRLPFDPIASFAPVAGLFTLPLMIVANNEFPATTPKELINALKAKPGAYSYATAGVGTVQHLSFEMLKAKTGVFVVHIPYRGASQLVPDVIGGQVPLGVVSITAGIAQAKTGKLKAIAMMSPVKMPGAEDVRPLSEVIPGYSVAPRLSLLAPAGTPAPVLERLAEALNGILSSPELALAANSQGAVPAFMPSAALKADLIRESAQWKSIIADQKIVA